MPENHLEAEQPEYSNWVSRRLIIGPGVAGLAFLGLSLAPKLPFMVGTMGMLYGEK